MSATATASTLDLTFSAPLCRGAQPGAWTTVILSDSSLLLGTRKPVKVGGHVDAQPFRATLLPVGDGTHMMPLKAPLRIAVGKNVGEHVTVRLTERYQ